MKTLKFLSLPLALTLSLAVVSCGDDDDDDSPTGPTGAAEFEMLQLTLDAYLDSDKAPTIAAQALFDNLNDGDATNDPMVLSVRAPQHYDIGHIPGAINIPWRQVAKVENLEKLPTDRQIAVYCYTGHTGGVATTALNAMGYDAVNLKFGIMSWTKDAEVRAAAPFSEDADAHDFPIETMENMSDSYALPDPDYSNSDVEAAIIEAAINAYVEATSPVISAQALFDNLNDGDATNDPLVLSVRSAAHYAIGHIPGAVNIPWRQVAKVENLEKLPTDRQIAVYCYTGHTGAVATTALNLLGYDAVNLKHGIMSWTRDDAARVITPFSEDTTHDFAVVSN